MFLKKALPLLVLLAAGCLAGPKLWAQTPDSTSTVLINGDDAAAAVANAQVIAMAKPAHSPRRAAFLSAALPGLGQVYNEKYWKLPILYAGVATVVYFVDWNNDNYQTFRTALFAEVDGNPNTVSQFSGLLNVEQLRLRVNVFRRQRDLTIIVGGLVYLLNIVDALVDAHLKEFDVNENLSLRWGPSRQPLPGAFGGFSSQGIGLTLTF